MSSVYFILIRYQGIKKDGNPSYRLKRSVYHSLRFGYVSCLRATSAVNDVKFNFLTFSQGFEAVFLDSGEVNEYITAVFSFDETITFFCTEPFYFTLHDKSS